eukprot:scaffold47_cov258-Pinguiococcus_pyrenoidosus.AAC.111
MSSSVFPARLLKLMIGNDSVGRSSQHQQKAFEDLLRCLDIQRNANAAAARIARIRKKVPTPLDHPWSPLPDRRSAWRPCAPERVRAQDSEAAELTVPKIHAELALAAAGHPPQASQMGVDQWDWQKETNLALPRETHWAPPRETNLVVLRETHWAPPVAGSSFTEEECPLGRTRDATPREVKPIYASPSQVKPRPSKAKRSQIQSQRQKRKRRLSGTFPRCVLGCSFISVDPMTTDFPQGLDLAVGAPQRPRTGNETSETQPRILVGFQKLRDDRRTKGSLLAGEGIRALGKEHQQLEQSVPHGVLGFPCDVRAELPRLDL